MKDDRKRLYQCAPRGFCAGVDRAILAVELALLKYGAPVYLSHDIVHNAWVVNHLKTKGAITVDNPLNIPDATRPYILSAHGSAKKFVERSRSSVEIVIDAVCPLVTKVHTAARSYNNKGMHVLLIGHDKHQEVVGTMGQLPDGAVTLIETEDDARSFTPADGVQIAYVTQTTLSQYDTENIVAILKKRFPDIVEPRSSHICYATTNRQNAVKQVAGRCDVFIVIGSKNSSNSNRLREVAISSGAGAAYQIDKISELDTNVIASANSIGLISGASAPEVLVKELATYLSEQHGFSIENVSTVDELEKFNVPRELEDIAAHSNIYEIMKPYHGGSF